jgi:hypothetical protein
MNGATARTFERGGEGIRQRLLVDALIADDKEHQMRQAGQGTDAKTRDLEFVGEAQAARFR